MNSFHSPMRTMVAACLALAACLGLNRTILAADSPDTGDQKGVEVLTRGPVHEAFAGVVTFNPEPGVVVPKPPPEPIEEMPPDEKPEGANVTWIPGYWAWDDERNDFLWVSGVWRSLPPGRQWVPGYWTKAGQGYQWISGYWADARAAETTYLAPPPASVEEGPNIAAPSPDHIWVPGCWVWYQNRYAWRPGYWVVGQPDRAWCPAYYVWTPRGYVFVDGYWDYSVERRGVLFAPVYFEPWVYGRHGYYYSPAIVINLGVFPDHCFMRPRYHHCYFGDYYAASYYNGGFYIAFIFQDKHHGYDPIYCHRRWEHRHDRDWDHHVQATYQYRRDHEDARPPRTWVAGRSLIASGKPVDKSLVVATTFTDVSKRKDSAVRFQPVAKEEKQQIVQRGQEMRKSREDRRTIEATAVDASNTKTGKQTEPVTAKPPRSPISAKPSDSKGKDQAPPVPYKAPSQDSKIGAKSDNATPDPSGNKAERKSESPKPEYKEKPVPSKTETKPEKAPPSKRDAQPEAQRPSKQEGKQDSTSPAGEKQSDNGKDSSRNDTKGQDSKGDDQRTPSTR